VDGTIHLFLRYETESRNSNAIPFSGSENTVGGLPICLSCIRHYDIQTNILTKLLCWCVRTKPLVKAQYNFNYFLMYLPIQVFICTVVRN
jgi:hypothetical protein